MMMTVTAHIPPPIFLFFLGLVVLYCVSYARWRARTRGLPLPPGPKALPFIGNIVLASKPEHWKVNRELCNTYGKSRSRTSMSALIT